MHAFWFGLFACRATAPGVEPTPPEPVESVEVTSPAEVRDVVYFVFVDRFADGRPDAPGTVDRADPQAWHGGDLQGVIDRLDHLQDLGVGGVWLSPITQARTEKIDEWGAFHAYWVEDLGAVEPRLGTMDEARALSAELDRRGMGLWLDIVYNHVGYDTPLTTEQPDWFHHNGDILDWNDPVQVVTHDVHGLPDLAQENPEVYAHLLDASLFWLRELKPTGFRVDAVRHLPDGFLARMGDALRAESEGGFEMLGEVFEGHAGALAARQRSDKLDRVFDFPLHYAMKDVFCGDQHLGRIASTLSQDRAYTNPKALVTFLDNHDVSRIRSACGEDRDRMARAVAFLLASRGTPCLTYGTEAALSGAEEPANRADMVFEGEGTDPEMHALLKALMDLRAQSPALRDGTTVIEQATATSLVVRRDTEAERAWIAVNLGDAEVPGPAGLPEDAHGWWVSGATAPVAATDRVPPDSVAIWLAPNPKAKPTPDPVPWTLTLTDEADTPTRLVGAGDALGNWNPDAAPAFTDGTLTLTVPHGDVLAFKLVRQNANGSWTWEDRSDRYAHVQGQRTDDLSWNATDAP